jgi:pilus assembly protein Flp/PilA
MTQFMSSVKNFLVSEDGPTAVEYAIMLALIVIVCIGAVQSIGTKAAAKFTAAGAALQSF